MVTGLKSAKSAEVDTLLDEAESRESCAVAADRSEAKALATRCAHGLVISPAPGLYARPARWDGLSPAQRTLWLARGMGRRRPGSVLCGVSAAVLFGLEVPYPLLRRLHLVSHGSPRRQKGSIVVARHAKRGFGVVEVGDLLATSPEVTVIDCLRWSDFRKGLAIADSALRVFGWGTGHLVDLCDAERSGLRGITRARMTAAHADARSENGGESQARAAMWELGYAVPDLQVEVDDPLRPGHVRRVDFCWRHPDGRVTFGELDGMEKYENPEMATGGALRVLAAERRRESALTIARAGIARFSFVEAMDDATLRRILDAFDVPRDHDPLPGHGAVSDHALVEHDFPPLEAYGLE